MNIRYLWVYIGCIMSSMAGAMYQQQTAKTIWQRRMDCVGKADHITSLNMEAIERNERELEEKEKLLRQKLAFQRKMMKRNSRLSHWIELSCCSHLLPVVILCKLFLAHKQIDEKSGDDSD